MVKFKGDLSQELRDALGSSFDLAIPYRVYHLEHHEVENFDLDEYTQDVIDEKTRGMRISPVSIKHLRALLD